MPTRNAVAVELERDYAGQIRDGNWSHILEAAKIKLNPASRKSDTRIVHNKLLSGWYVVRGPHQTPISGRFDSKAEAQAWLDRNKSNPAARKKKMTAKKKTAAKKKPAAKKKAAAKKRIAINAPSRATGKPPSKRLRSRRARNTVQGAYPNPKARTKYIIEGVTSDGYSTVYYTGSRFDLIPRSDAAQFNSVSAAKKQFMQTHDKKMRDRIANSGAKVRIVPVGKT